MKHVVKTLMVVGLASLGSLAPSHVVAAQVSNRGQPTAAFGVADFAKLRWLEGSWAGSAPGERGFFERCRVVDDTTMEIRYFGDSAFEHETSTGRLYLSVGRIYHTMGPGRWGATHVDEKGVYFVPQTNAQNTFVWNRDSNDEWTSTLRSGFVGQGRVTVYHMKRTRP